MARETVLTPSRETAPAAADIDALAAQLRHDVDHAVFQWEPTIVGTVEARFLRRLAGALAAYETARGILAPADPVAVPTSET